MSSGQTSQPPVARRRPQGSWIGAGLIACGRGAALTGAGLAEAALLCALALAVILTGAGLGPLLIPALVLASRWLLNRLRRLAGDGGHVPAGVPCRPRPDPADLRFRQRPGWLLTGQETWRDVLGLTVDPAVGWILTLGPALLLLDGLSGAVSPAVRAPIADAGGRGRFFFLPLTSTLTAWLAVPLGLVLAAGAVRTAPRSLGWHAALARSVLGPTRQAELAQRVSHLARTRRDSLDASAAEIRRIERDLHDGAQARLVAMGMAGLAGLARRLAAFDGILAISSPPGGPTVVSMEIPCALSSPKTCSS